MANSTKKALEASPVRSAIVISEKASQGEAI